MSVMDDLLDAYATRVGLPWDDHLSGAQRVWFVVYEPAHERRLRLQVPEFEARTRTAGHGWHLLDLTTEFSRWMAEHEYRDAYFEFPDDMTYALADFESGLATKVRDVLREHDHNTVVALSGLASLFGLTRVSTLIESVAGDVNGRLVAFFPGQYVQTTYRLLDARDGWNYLAVPIVAREEQ